ncbi:MAG: hypothetical protein RSE29_02750 [Leclercia sp.]
MLGSIEIPIRNIVIPFTFETQNKDEMMNVTLKIKEVIDSGNISLHFTEVSNDPFFRELKASLLSQALNSFISLCFYSNDRLPRLLTFTPYDYFGKDGDRTNTPEVPGDAKMIFNLFTEKSHEEISKGNALWCVWNEFLCDSGQECIGIQVVHRYFKLMYTIPVTYHFISKTYTGFTIHLDQIKCKYHGR